MTPFAAFLQRAITANASDAAITDIQRALEIIDEISDQQLTTKRALELLEELSMVEARIVIADARAKR
jgi:hypothetical protein